MSPVLGIVCGIASEARTLGRWHRDPRIAVAIAGASSERARAAAEAQVARGVSGLLSWGIAGALIPDLGPGDLLVPAVAASYRSPDIVLNDGVDLLGARAGGRLWTTDHVVCAPGEKAALGRIHAAIAVDMETCPLAEVAEAAGLPAFAVRAVSDPCHRRLPALVGTAVDDAGTPRLGAVLAGLARRPGDLPALIRAGLDSGRALLALREAAPAVIPALLAEVAYREADTAPPAA